MDKLEGIWFTSDHHFGHENIIKFCDRPYSSSSEMDQALIDLWNAKVGPDDHVYHLGDFTLNDLRYARTVFAQLCGQIKIIPGGHDWRWLKDFEGGQVFSRSGYPVEILSPLVSLEFPLGGKHPFVIVLCHYSMRVWDRSHYGSWHLYGHSHGNLPPLEHSYDVGVDTNGFCPAWLGEIEGLLCPQK